MKKYIIKLSLYMLFISIVIPSIAQNIPILGRTIDTSNIPIVGVSVIVFAMDSTYITFTNSDEDGNFSLLNVEPPCRFLFNHIGYKEYEKIIISTNIGDITLAPSALQLSKVVVKEYRPIVNTNDGKLSYNLTQLSQNSTATNVYEALSYLPGIDEENGKLSLAGVGTVSVIINGKTSTMSQSQLETLLRTMPIERIECAEIMYSTPPQYGVRGASINLVLKQTRNHSYSGQINTGFSNRCKNSWNTGGSIVVSTPKWSADAMYSYRDYYSPEYLELSTKHTISSETKIIEQLEDTYSRGKKHTLRAAFDYTPTENNSLSFVYNGEFTPSVYSTAHSEGSYVKSLNNKKGDRYLHNIALRYNIKEGLDIGADYTTYSNGNSGNLNNLYNDGSTTSFNVRNGQNINRLNLYAGTNHTLKRGWSLNYGTRATWANSKDCQHYGSIVGNVESKDTESDLTEINTELYSGFSKTLSKGSISASLAGEYYYLEGKSRWQLYPQINFMWMFNQNNILQANISSDKTYPSYWMLQDAISFVDGYTELHGNPYLRPIREYSSQLIYIYKQRYIFVLFGSQNNDYFIQNAYMVPDRFTLIYKNINFDYSRQYGVNMIIPLNIGKWLNSKLTLVGLRMEQKCSDFFGSSFNRATWMGIAKLYNTVKFSNNFSLELNSIYQSPAIQGLFDLKQSWGVDAGVKWSLLNKTLDITAKCNDIFQSRTPRVVQDWQGQQLNMYSGAYNRLLSINISYSFGGYTNKERRKVDSSRFGY